MEDDEDDNDGKHDPGEEEVLVVRRLGRSVTCSVVKKIQIWILRSAPRSDRRSAS